MKNAESADAYVLERYSSAIKYYWQVSSRNKNYYKFMRSIVVILGALVTLVASLSSANFITSNRIWDTAFAISTPVLAAILTIAGGFSQTFHWGAAWSEMALNAERLERERDRIIVAKPEERKPAKELAIFNNLVITETQTFFQRILGGARSGKDKQKAQDELA